MHAPVGAADTTTAIRILLDAFERVGEMLPDLVRDLSDAELGFRADEDANSIGWLVWHLTRVQDDHLAGVNGSEQVWTAQDWAGRFALPYDDSSIGYGQDSEDVGRFFVEDPALLTGYHAATQARTRDIISGLTNADLERVIDDSYDPPVTVEARLVSVINDTTQHIGQAAYVRGLVERRKA